MSNKLSFKETKLNGLLIITKNIFKDKRGSLIRHYCQKEINSISSIGNVVQINETRTINKGIIRGMHYQYPPNSEDKIITCLEGEIFDVAIDLRNNSPTFLNWHGEILNQNNGKSLLIPKGFAHGFQTLSEKCRLLYFHTANYLKESEGGLNPMDPLINIKWPENIEGMSEKDRNYKYINNKFEGVVI